MREESIKRISNVVELRNNNFTYQEIANIYGVTRQRVEQYIKCNKKWNVYNYLYVTEETKNLIRNGTVGKYYFNNKKCKSGAEVIRKAFPKISEHEIFNMQRRVCMYANENNTTFEEACNIMRERNNNKTIAYNNCIYKNKMEMIRKLFPNKDYKNVYYSIMQRMKVHNISFIEALEKTIEYNNSQTVNNN